MSKPDQLLVDAAALVGPGHSNRMSVTMVAGGAGITGRLAPEADWRQRVSEVIADSDRLSDFSAVFTAAPGKEGPPTHLHFHVADLAGSGGDPGDGRDVPGGDRGRQCLDDGRLQLRRALSASSALPLQREDGLDD